MTAKPSPVPKSVSMKSPTVSMSVVESLFQTVAERGVSRTALAEAAGIEISRFASPENRVTIEEMERLTVAAEALSGDRNLGLHQGQQVVSGTLSIVGYVMMNCGTLGEAIEKYRAYQRVVGEGIRITVKPEGGSMKPESGDAKPEGDGVRIEMMPVESHPNRHRHILEGTASATLITMQALSGRAIALRRAEFTHPEPDETAEHARIFQAPVRFGQAVNALVCDAAVMAYPVRQPNRELLAVFESHAELALAKLGAVETVSSRVRRILIEHLKGESPDIAFVARRLAMSVRSLQQKLKEEHLSYRDLLGDVQCDLAKRYLLNPEVTIGEVAYLLGFSEQSVFQRTFKRRTGMTPKTFRHSA